MDWSILRLHSRYFLLRQELVYTNHVSWYYFAMVSARYFLKRKVETFLGDKHIDPLPVDSIHSNERPRRHVAVIYCGRTGDSSTLAVEFL